MILGLGLMAIIFDNSKYYYMHLIQYNSCKICIFYKMTRLYCHGRPSYLGVKLCMHINQCFNLNVKIIKLMIDK